MADVLRARAPCNARVFVRCFAQFPCRARAVQCVHICAMLCKIPLPRGAVQRVRICAMLCTGGNRHREISHRHLLLRVGKCFEVRADIELTIVGEEATCRRHEPQRVGKSAETDWR